jgi:hypothetical protein
LQVGVDGKGALLAGLILNARDDRTIHVDEFDALYANHGRHLLKIVLEIGGRLDGRWHF